jgi:hypothetical protein
MANTAASTLINLALDNASRLGTTTTKNGTPLSTFGITVLNRTMYRISRKHNFRECKKTYSAATIDGTKSYTFPPTYKTIHDIRLIDGSSSLKLVHLQSQYFDDVVAYPENHTEGRPGWYIPYGDNFDLYPIPDAVYTMYTRCTIWPIVITASTDLVTYKPDKDDLLVYGMTEELFQLLQLHEDAAVYNGKFRVALREAIDLDSNYPDWSPVGQGFEHSRDRYIGDPWKDPMRRSS